MPQQAQTTVYKEKNKWGIQEKGMLVIPAVYDTLFNFDSTGRVCMACMKVPNAYPGKFIKNYVINYHCSYLNKKGERLLIKLPEGDTTGIFTLQKNSFESYAGRANIFTVAVKDKNRMDQKNIVDKDFHQLTYNGYEDIALSPCPAFFIAKVRTGGNVVLTGLLNRREENILPFKYSFIKFNTTDSLIIGCTAGQGISSEDDIFNYEGKKITSYHRHIELAAKNFVVARIFQPKDQLIIMNLATGNEEIEQAEEVNYFSPDKFLMMKHGRWYTYDLCTHKKKSYEIKHKK